MNAGAMPNFAELRKNGSFRPLGTTCPPISPVAWSSFITGVNPGKHRIFDFLNRDLNTYFPELSSTRVEMGARSDKSVVTLLRKSKPFWHVLADHGVFSSILRVPITYPPENFRGVCLAGMCVPDLRGSQGTFSRFSTEISDELSLTGGDTQHVTFRDQRARTFLTGPPAPPGGPDEFYKAPLSITLREGGRLAVIGVSGQSIPLREGAYSDWIRVQFRIGLWKKIHGICRFRWTRSQKGFQLYATPVHIDPERPALPISHPAYFSIYLAKLIGSYATLGLAEDTWARNEGVIDDEAFLEQAYAIHDERERMFFESVKRTRKGLCACVFDAPDRIQHMFLQTAHDDAHPAGEGREKAYEEIIDRMYVRMDELVGRLGLLIKEKDVLFVISDHGFTTFRRGLNLNAWMRENGYLQTRAGCEDAQYLQGIDWDKTQAYTFGLSGVYLNRAGREKGGIIDRDEVDTLKAELRNRLEAIVDDQTGEKPIRRVYDAATTYQGPYQGEGPDLIVGYADGYRASWEAAVGRADGPLFSDNQKAWRGDHCVDPEIVPGIFFANRKVKTDEELRLLDMGATILKLFGISTPKYMDGKAIPLE
jgi:predicted AlkP superfamily phosphohydrolase/phosphomutase